MTAVLNSVGEYTTSILTAPLAGTTPTQSEVHGIQQDWCTKIIVPDGGKIIELLPFILSTVKAGWLRR